MGNARSDTRSLASVHYLSISGDEHRCVPLRLAGVDGS
jgi:hypothetical protein